MSATDIVAKYWALPPDRQRYALQYFAAYVGEVATGPRQSLKEKRHAEWTLKQLETSINKAKP